MQFFFFWKMHQLITKKDKKIKYSYHCLKMIWICILYNPDLVFFRQDPKHYLNELFNAPKQFGCKCLFGQLQNIIKKYISRFLHNRINYWNSSTETISKRCSFIEVYIYFRAMKVSYFLDWIIRKLTRKLNINFRFDHIFPTCSWNHVLYRIFSVFSNLN